MAKTKNTNLAKTKATVLSVAEIKAQLEEAELRAKLSDARARNLEAAVRQKKARLLNKIIDEKNIKEYL